jgi:hypothetical protein
MKITKIFQSSLILMISLPLLAVAVGLALPLAASAETTYSSLDYYPQVQIPVSGSSLDQASTTVGTYQNGGMSSTLLARYIQTMYTYGLMIAAILAAIVLMGGGVLWLTSAGNDSRVTQAKELISGSVVGLIILFSSWIILNTINPNLLKLQAINTQIVRAVQMGCCRYTDSASLNTNGTVATMMSSTDCTKQKNSAFLYNQTDSSGNVSYYHIGSNGTSCVLPGVLGCCVVRDANSNISSCINTTQDICTSQFPNQEFKNYSCTQVSPEISSSGTYSCQGRTDLCATAADGDSCFSGGYHSGPHCYNHVCWYGLGNEGEPCGNDAGAKCLKTKPDNYCHDNIGGRDCASGLYCEYPCS